MWQKDKWWAVRYSDEFKFNLFGSDQQEWCCRRPGDEFRDSNTQKTVKHGGGSVMVWGCITPYSVSHLQHIDGIMDAGKYIRILNNNLLGILHDYIISSKITTQNTH